MLLERVLERERVQDGGDHAHVVGGRAVHPGSRAGHAAVDVAGADDERELQPLAVDPSDRRGDAVDAGRVGAVLEVAEQGLAGDLEQDSPVGESAR